jgi:hypothetical protein
MLLIDNHLAASFRERVDLPQKLRQSVSQSPSRRHNIS